MEAKEFRAGNLLNYTSAEGDVLETSLDWQDFKWLEEDRKGFEAVHDYIPLTEDWLIDFGFHIDREWKEITNPDTEDEEDIIFHKVKKYELKGWLNRCMYFIVEHGVVYCYVTPRYLTNTHYVHQVQNLFHSIRGKELTKKEQ